MNIIRMCFPVSVLLSIRVEFAAGSNHSQPLTMCLCNNHLGNQLMAYLRFMVCTLQLSKRIRVEYSRKTIYSSLLCIVREIDICGTEKYFHKLMIVKCTIHTCVYNNYT